MESGNLLVETLSIESYVSEFCVKLTSVAEFIESVFTLATKSRSSQRPIVIPQWLRRCGERWSRIPNVESVLLFGSRATGHAVPSSDWDVALLHTGTEWPRIPGVPKHHVGFAYLSVDKYCREAHLVGSLAHEIAVHAILIAGRDNYRIQKELGTSEEDLTRLLRTSFKDLGMALTELHYLWVRIGRPRNFETVTEFTDASTASIDGAERVAKALCVHLGISYVHTHNVEGLAKEVPHAWRSKLLSMDGHTRAAQLADYTDFEEPCGTILQRVDNSLSLLSEFLEPCLEHMSSECIRALVHELETTLHVGSALDLHGSAEDVPPSIHDLLRRYYANVELVFERNRFFRG